MESCSSSANCLRSSWAWGLIRTKGVRLSCFKKPQDSTFTSSYAALVYRLVYESLLLMDGIDRIEPRCNPCGIDSGENGDTPDEEQRASQERIGRVELNGPTEALLVYHENE